VTSLQRPLLLTYNNVNTSAISEKLQLLIWTSILGPYVERLATRDGRKLRFGRLLPVTGRQTESREHFITLLTTFNAGDIRPSQSLYSNVAGTIKGSRVPFPVLVFRTALLGVSDVILLSLR
jgi:hypothetical protein